MTEFVGPSAKSLNASIEASLENGSRLLGESYFLESLDPPASQYYLIMIAQEEFAKAFILYLVREEIAPFSEPIRRAINDHRSKQLVGMILDYMIMHWDDFEELKEAVRTDAELGDGLPNDVGSAIKILCYEKIGRWAGRNYIESEKPDYDSLAKKIFAGKKDQKKQDALYVRIGRDGRPCSSPASVTNAETQDELERACRYCRFVIDVMEGSVQSERLARVIETLNLLLADVQPMELENLNDKN